MKFRFKLTSEKAGYGPLSNVRVQLIARNKGATFVVSELATNTYGYGVFSIRDELESEIFLRLTPDFEIKLHDFQSYPRYPAEFLAPEGVEAEAEICHTLPWHTDELGLDDISAIPSAFPQLGNGAFGTGYCGRLLPGDRVPEFSRLKGVRRTIRDRLECKESGLFLQGGEALTHEVKHSFLGLSLGRVLKSTTLMPCEKVTISVREWTNRTKQTTQQSNQSGQTQTQTIDDQQSLNELVQQSASTFSTALELSVPLSDSIGVALGVGYSTSEAESSIRQDLARSMRATASAYRSERVVGLAEVNQTYAQQDVVRTFCNNNHCHTLNVIWRQVYENYRSEIRHLGTQKVVFWPQTVEEFTPEKIACKRYLLENNLLDPSLEDCWEGFSRNQAKPSTPAPNTSTPAGNSAKISTIDMIINMGNDGFSEKNAFEVTVKLKDGSSQKVPVTRDSRWKRNTEYDEKFSLNTPVDPTEISQITIHNESTGVGAGSLYINSIEFFFTDNGKKILYSGPAGGTIKKGASKSLDVNFRGADDESGNTKPPSLPDPQDEKDEICATQLQHHIQCNSHYYSQLLWLGMDIEERRCMFENITCNGRPLTDFIDPAPLGLWGCNLVFVRVDIPFLPNDEPEVSEELITLPTNGVFADAALGRCGTCETIDDGVFRDFDKGHCGCGGADTISGTPKPEGIDAGLLVAGEALEDLLDKLPAGSKPSSVLAKALEALAKQNSTLITALLKEIKAPEPKEEKPKPK